MSSHNSSCSSKDSDIFWLYEQAYFYIYQKCLEFFQWFTWFSAIDTNCEPYTLSGSRIESHVGTGSVTFKGSKFAKALYVPDSSNNTGYQLLKELEIKMIPVTNACILDWLLFHPLSIPRAAWSGKKVLFLGTIYKVHNGNLFVRFLDCTGSTFTWGTFCLNEKMNDDMFVLLLP